ncbi:MAG: restriction endonuclease subunit S [Fibrobacter sp.]|uniref:restriction endonuclease subunit S n=1 Tax=Fibrobacter sp. TaxID=35828 RepID=UPI0025BF2BE2|nr:restriction endonuclease subunit S [Fibrobacter sp.]MBQ9226559.1 restriction endonuclease subunit S [Fibrobacter sp.]
MEMRKITLGDCIIDCASGPFGSNLKVECFVEDGFPIIDGANLKGVRVTDNITKFVTEEKARSLSRSIAKRRDVIVTISGTLGQISFIPNDSKYNEYLCSQRQFRVTFDESKIDVEYLVNYLHTDFGQKKILSFANYVGVPALAQPLPNFKKIELLIPSIQNQKKVVQVLSALDDKIALNKKMNQKLEAMAKRLYDYWFVQYDFPDKNGHPYKTTGGPMTYNPTLKREIPAGWEVSFVSDVIKPIDRGISYTSEEIKDSSGIPMINLACFDKKGNYRTGELKFYSGEYDESNKVYPLDILIACTDLTQKADIIGTPIFLSAEAPFYVFSTDLAKITPKNESHKYFLYYYLKNPTFHRYIKPFASGTTVKHLNVKGVENYPIFIPDEKVVKQFTETVRPMVIAINERINEINCLTALRDKLLPLLMNGQVVVD